MEVEVIAPEVLLAAYRNGIFPMAPERDAEEVDWIQPRQRGILPLDSFHVPRNVAAHLRRTPYRVTVNAAFEAVVTACGERDETWISPLIIRSYCELHRLGHAHSLELWLPGPDGRDLLVGGQYGVALGAAFCGESIFRRQPYADQAALVLTHRHLLSRGFELWDCQFYTEHLGRFGCIEIPQARYLKLLEGALGRSARFD